MSLPPLPKHGKWLHEQCGQKVYTEAQLIAYGRQCVEKVAIVFDGIYTRAGHDIAEVIRNMLKGEE
jgi:hypothetical protein